MTVHACKNAALSALAVTAMVGATPAYAAGDYHIKFGGVDGEVKEPKSPAAAQKDHEKWILLESVQLGTARAAGGVTVASGDVTGDGANSSSAHPYEPVTIRKRIDKSTPAPAADAKIASPHDTASGQATGKRSHGPIRAGTYYDQSAAPAPGNLTMPTPDPEAVALLLPAVQKVREAAMRTPAWEGCAAGQAIKGMAIRQVSTGRKGRILDPVVVSCATDSVSFNFTKIDWD